MPQTKLLGRLQTVQQARRQQSTIGLLPRSHMNFGNSPGIRQDRFSHIPHDNLRLLYRPNTHGLSHPTGAPPESARWRIFIKKKPLSDRASF
ncbi:MAG: hypothetical protein VX974_05995 [Pseudomonadota bacterium]|nr:hypothetical protein [Pseudomonadota bacterium]